MGYLNGLDWLNRAWTLHWLRATLSNLMAERYASNPVDRVAGLKTYIENLHWLQIADHLQPKEEAWVRLLDRASADRRARIAFQYPCIGDGCCSWHKSWAR